MSIEASVLGELREAIRSRFAPRRHTALLAAIVAAFAVRLLIGDTGAGSAVFGVALLETQDIYLLLDSRRSLELIVSEVRCEGLIGILRKIDKSFTVMEKQNFRAVNDRGFMVDLIRPMPKPPWKKQPDMVGKDADLKAADIEHLDWYLSVPKLSTDSYRRRQISGILHSPRPKSLRSPQALAQQAAWPRSVEETQGLRAGIFGCRARNAISAAV
jgi:hypothetical protein